MNKKMQAGLVSTLTEEGKSNPIHSLLSSILQYNEDGGIESPQIIIIQTIE